MLLVLFLCLFVSVFAFNIVPIRNSLQKKSNIVNRREYTNPSRLFLKTSTEEGYGPIGSLIRQGPVPFFIRLTNPDKYEAAVKKYMALEKCDRMTAQGNMDAYFQDPNGWASDKLRARQTGQEIDYGRINTDKKSLILTGVWAIGITALFVRIFVVQVLQHGTP
jgi:hypothetical protein